MFFYSNILLNLCLNCDGDDHCSDLDSLKLNHDSIMSNID